MPGARWRRPCAVTGGDRRCGRGRKGAALRLARPYRWRVVCTPAATAWRPARVACPMLATAGNGGARVLAAPAAWAAARAGGTASAPARGHRRRHVMHARLRDLVCGAPTGAPACAACAAAGVRRFDWRAPFCGASSARSLRRPGGRARAFALPATCSSGCLPGAGNGRERRRASSRGACGVGGCACLGHGIGARARSPATACAWCAAAGRHRASAQGAGAGAQRGPSRATRAARQAPRRAVRQAAPEQARRAHLPAAPKQDLRTGRRFSDQSATRGSKNSAHPGVFMSHVPFVATHLFGCVTTWHACSYYNST